MSKKEERKGKRTVSEGDMDIEYDRSAAVPVQMASPSAPPPAEAFGDDHIAGDQQEQRAAGVQGACMFLVVLLAAVVILCVYSSMSDNSSSSSGGCTCPGTSAADKNSIVELVNTMIGNLNSTLQEELATLRSHVVSLETRIGVLERAAKL